MEDLIEEYLKKESVEYYKEMFLKDIEKNGTLIYQHYLIMVNQLNDLTL